MDPITLTLIGGAALFAILKSRSASSDVDKDAARAATDAAARAATAQTSTTETPIVKPTKTTVLVIPTELKSPSVDYYQSGQARNDFLADIIRVRNIFLKDISETLNAQKYQMSGFGRFGYFGGRRSTKIPRFDRAHFGAPTFVSAARPATTLQPTRISQPRTTTGIPKLEIKGTAEQIAAKAKTLEDEAKAKAIEDAKIEAQENWARARDAQLMKAQAMASAVAMGYAKSLNSSRIDQTQREPNGLLQSDSDKMQWYLERGAYFDQATLDSHLYNLELLSGGMGVLSAEERAALEKRGDIAAQSGLYLIALQKPKGLLQSGDAEKIKWYLDQKNFFRAEDIDDEGNAKILGWWILGRDSLSQNVLVYF